MTTNGENPRKAYMREYYLKNKERVLAKNREYALEHRPEVLAWNRQYHQDHKETANAKRREHWLSHKEQNDETRRKWATENKKHLSEKNKIYRIENHDEVIAYGKNWRLRLACDVKDFLGGSCECCGEQEFEFLALDHRNNDGGGMNRHNYKDYTAVWDAWHNGTFEEAKKKYQLLCHNCNWSKHRGKGVCRHKRESLHDVSGSGMYQRKIANVAKGYLGTLCSCCNESIQEFLCIDHVNNDGNLEKKNSNGTRNTYKCYIKIIDTFKGGNEDNIKHIKNQLQLLCWNCNESKADYSLCAHKRKSPGHF